MSQYHVHKVKFLLKNRKKNKIIFSQNKFLPPLRKQGIDEEDEKQHDKLLQSSSDIFKYPQGILSVSWLQIFENKPIEKDCKKIKYFKL